MKYKEYEKLKGKSDFVFLMTIITASFALFGYGFVYFSTIMMICSTFLGGWFVGLLVELNGY